MSTSKDKMPLPGDEVLYVEYPPKERQMAWIHFVSGKSVEVRIWCDEVDPETGLLPADNPPDPNIPKAEQ